MVSINQRCSLLIFTVATFLILGNMNFSKAESLSDKPYNAKTVEECIHEKECVWHHFLLAIQAAPVKQAASENINLKKWTKPVRYRRVGKSEAASSQIINGHINQILPFFHQKFTANDKFNFLIVVTDDIEGELSGEFKPLFDQMFGKDAVLTAYQRDVQENNKKCHYIHLQDSKKNFEIFSYFAFIQKDHSDIEACLKEVIYAGFGMSSLKFSPIVKTHSDSNTYSKLELVLLHMLYQDYFRSGMSLSQVRQVFDKIYEPLIEQVDKSEVFSGK